MLACLLPAMLGAAAVLYRSYLNERAQLERDTIQTARALMQTVDAELTKSKLAAQTLATSGYLATGNFAAFHAQALQMVPHIEFDSNFILIDPFGQQLVNTLRPFPGVLPRHGNVELIRQVVASGQPVTSNLYAGAIRKRPVAAIAVPVSLGNQVRYVLSLTFPPESLGRILNTQQLPPDWVVSIFDGQGQIAYRSHGIERFLGQKGAPALMARMRDVPEGIVETNTLEGIPVSAAFNRSTNTHWSVAIGIPTQTLVADLRERFTWLMLMLAGLLAAGTVLAVMLSRRIGGSIRALSGPALALGKGELVSLPHLHTQEAEEVGTALVAASALLRQSEQLRLESEARLQLAAQAAHLGAFSSELEKGLNYWSPEMRQIIGVPADTPALPWDVIPDYIHPDDLGLVQATYARVFDPASDGRIDDEHRIVWPDGSVHWVQLTGRAEFDGEGSQRRAVRMRGFIQDITERKQAEAEIKAAAMEAERANRAKSRFLAAASHDLRQPLAALALYMSILKIRGGPAIQPMLVNFGNCLNSLSGLLNDLLDLSKLDAGVVQPKPSPFALAETLTSLGAVYAPQAQAKGLRLRWRAADAGLMAHTDPVLFQRLLGNLIDNAIRYTERGGVLVACRRRQGKTWVEVWDSGIGIAADQTEVIFEEFRQLGDAARNRGSGLGLAIVARTARLLGLAISVRSRPGRGSVFAIELPLASAAPNQAPSVPAKTSLRALRIALVDDNAMVRQALAEALQAAGHEVLASGASGTELLAALGAQVPDVLVSDYRLTEGQTGFDVISAVRARHGATLPAILITGDTDPALLRSMTERGIGILHKPIDLDVLQRRLQDLIARDAPAHSNGPR
jgi:PAS domain S-box-containing protein